MNLALNVDSHICLMMPAAKAVDAGDTNDIKGFVCEPVAGLNVASLYRTLKADLLDVNANEPDVAKQMFLGKMYTQQLPDALVLMGMTILPLKRHVWFGLSHGLRTERPSGKIHDLTYLVLTLSMLLGVTAGYLKMGLYVTGKSGSNPVLVARCMGVLNILSPSLET